MKNCKKWQKCEELLRVYRNPIITYVLTSEASVSWRAWQGWQWGGVGLGGLGSACLDGLAGLAVLLYRFWWAWECVLTGLAVVWCRSWRAWECCAVLVLADLGVVCYAVLCWSWRALQPLLCCAGLGGLKLGFITRRFLIGLFLFKNLKKQIYQ